ncbi:MAG: extracellular solute-binding protein [Oscillospiraceae bacterium]|jgi:hypothetical protein|nr:extracellular solute-binding protein [Oscillospiraceae bacterium]
MLKKLTALGCVALTVFLLWRMPSLISGYPVNRDGLIRRKSWEGVLRVWICQDWSSTLPAWLSRQITAFEKEHKGVHVRVQKVAPGAWENEASVPPDILLFSPGMLSAPQDILIPFAPSEEFLPETLRSGRWMGEQYALPVALGGYAVLFNEGLFPPGVALIDPQPIKKQQRYALNVARGGALAALIGWDEGVRAARTLRMPEEFGTSTSDQAYAAFVAGNVGALVCSIDHARKFAAREAAGKGFAYRIETPLSGFCDQIAMIGRIRRDTNDGRSDMANEFVWFVTGKAAQDTLANFGLLPVRTDAAEPSAVTPALAALYNRYKTQLITPNAYGWSAVKDTFFDQSLYALMSDVGAIHDTIEQIR